MEEKNPPKKNLKWYYWVLIIIGVLIFVGLSNSSSTTQSSSNSSTGSSSAPAQSTATVYVGDDAYIAAGHVLVADDGATMDKFNKAVEANDTYGLQAMLSDGEAFELNSETEVLVIDQSGWAFDKEVRVLQGPHTGQTGWIDSSFVYKK